MKYIRNVLAALRKADETFALIDPGDVIALGISGGKDSLCLLKAMSLYGRFAKKDFRIVPITLDLGFPGFNAEKISEYCASLGMKLRVEDSREVFPILQSHTKEGGHIPCSICSRMKKAAINAAAKKYRCNKVAFAHHKDDAVETLFMNMIHGGRVATFEPYMRLDRAKITFIRPLIFASEADLTGMAKEECLPVMGKTCPADGFTEREWIKDKLKALYQERDGSEANLASMLYDYKNAKLYFEHIETVNPLDAAFSFRPLLSASQAIDYGEFAAKSKRKPLMKADETFLVYHAHRLKGHIAFLRPRAHEIVIVRFDGTWSKEEEKTVLAGFLAMLGRKENPLLVVYKPREKKSLLLSLGFTERIYEGKTHLAFRQMK